MNKNVSIDDTLKVLGSMSQQANASDSAVLCKQKNPDVQGMEITIRSIICGLLAQPKLSSAQITILDVLLKYVK